jgi:hypothetical protein
MTWEALNKSVPLHHQQRIVDDRNGFVMKICTICLGSNLLFQLISAGTMIKGQHYFGLLYQWVLFSIMCVLMFQYYFCNKKKMVYPLVYLMAIRQSFASTDPYSDDFVVLHPHGV